MENREIKINRDFEPEPPQRDINPVRKGDFSNRVKKWVCVFVVIFLLVGISFFVFKIAHTFNVVSLKDKLQASLGLEEPLHYDSSRINILILGIRGVDDPNGGLLTGTIMLASFKKDSKEAALISIPRDLYVELPGHPTKQRINFAYALGEKQGAGQGLVMAKRVVSQVTGLKIDYVVSVDFTAFQEVIDNLGGIDVYVPKDFRENLQWGEFEFFVSRGLQRMDGETALFYVRSRFTTSDFDRARRQQDVLVAIKNRTLSLNVLANPIKIFNFLDILGRHVRTDMDVSDMKDLLKLASKTKIGKIHKEVLDASSSGLLYGANINGSYVLLPVGGNYDRIHELAINIFEEKNDDK